MAISFQDFRTKNPSYDNVPDGKLIYGLYNKPQFEKVPLMKFANAIGLTSEQKMEFLKYAGSKGKNISFDTEGEPSYGGLAQGTARSAFQGLTFGGGDEIVGGGAAAVKKFKGDDRPFTDIYKEEQTREKQRVEDFRADYPKTALVSEIGGSLVLPFGATKTVGGMLATSGAMGGAAAFLNSDGSFNERILQAPFGVLLGMAFGGAFAVAGKTINEQVKSILTKRAAKAAAQGAEALETLKQQASQAYSDAFDQGVSIKPEVFKAMLDDVVAKVSGGRPLRSKITPQGADTIKAMNDELKRITKDNTGFSLDDIDYLRQLTEAGASNFGNKQEQRIAMIIKTNLDDFVNKLSKGDIYGGDVATATKALTEARETWSRMRKTEVIEELLRDARTYAGGLESGLRNSISKILRNRKRRRQFNKDELKLLTQIREGSPIGNLIGNMSMGGLSLTGGRSNINQMGITGVASAAIGAAVADNPYLGAAMGAIIEGSVATGVRYVRELQMEAKVKLFKDIIANGLAEEVFKKNPTAYKLLERAAGGSQAATKATIAAGDEPVATEIQSQTGVLLR
tara:strand:+ start:4066 stop:5772 length:1707 start_codon:yes stop_codon:yes gene_type:complete